MRTRHASLDIRDRSFSTRISFRGNFRFVPHREIIVLHRQNHAPSPFRTLIEIKSCHETIRGRKQPSPSLPTLIIAIDKDNLLYDSFLESSGEKAADRVASPPGLLPR